MTVSEWIERNTELLNEAGIATARLDCLVLLEETLGKDRGWLLAHPETEVDTIIMKQLDGLISRRAGHEPLAYVRGKTEFYGRDFIITPDVLEPRPESETMIELFKKLDLDDDSRVLDAGCGSGAIGITAKLERPELKVDLLDVDEACLGVAEQNCRKHNVELTLHAGDLLDGLSGRYTAILANLPYVPDGHTVNQAAMQEPRIAIFGGADGLDLYRRMFGQLKTLGADSKPRYVLTESLPFQHEALAGIARETGYRLEMTDDFIQQYSQAIRA
jgi:release factor glutamine methyltransferase